MTWTFTRGLWGVPDLLFGDSTTSATQTRRGTSGTQSVTIQRIDTAVFPLSTVVKTAYSLSGTQYLDAVLSTLATSTTVATTAARGITKVDDDAGGDPVALTTVGATALRIPTANQSAALGASGTAATAANYYPTLGDFIGAQAVYRPEYGDGSDGIATVGAITGTVSAPAVATSGSVGAGNITGDRYYKIAVGNLSGTQAASTASALVAPSSQNVAVTLPTTGFTNAQWIYIYACATSGGTYYEVGRANYGTATFTDRLPTLPSSGNTAPGSDTSGAASVTLSGTLQFSDMTGMGTAFTINIATTGGLAGRLTIRCQSDYNDENLTVNGVGAFRVAYNTRMVCSSTAGNLGTNSGPIGSTPSTLGSSSSAPTGIGADVLGPFRPGFGLKGATAGTITTEPVGGYAGGDLQVYAPRVKVGLLRGTYSLLGQAATVGAGTGSYGAAGGGGGPGGRAIFCFDEPVAGTATVSVAGGVGANGAGSGGASTAYGGPGGGGGIIGLFSPNTVTTGMTLTIAAGANGTDSTAASGFCNAGASGAHAGDGAVGGASPGTAAAGQTVTLSTYATGRMGVL